MRPFLSSTKHGPWHTISIKLKSGVFISFPKISILHSPSYFYICVYVIKLYFLKVWSYCYIFFYIFIFSIFNLTLCHDYFLKTWYVMSSGIFFFNHIWLNHIWAFKQNIQPETFGVLKQINLSTAPGCSKKVPGRMWTAAWCMEGDTGALSIKVCLAPSCYEQVERHLGRKQLQAKGDKCFILKLNVQNR